MIFISNLTNIWKSAASLKKEKAQVSLEISCINRERELRYKAPDIFHITTRILLSLAFYT